MLVEKKKRNIKKIKVLVNTGIHEAIPVSFLEAISYGVRILSCQNPDDLSSDNGRFTGQIFGGWLG